MMFTSLGFRNLDFYYHPDRPILNHVTCDFPMNQAVWIRAPATSGRSSLFKVLALLTAPKAGDYLINGESTRYMSFEESVPFRLKMGYGFDSGGLLNNRTLHDNLVLTPVYHKIWTPEEAHEHAMVWLKRFQLESSEKMLPSAVSGGQRKIATLIRALILEPEIVFLDEPTLGLNSYAQGMLIEQLADLRRQGRIRHVFLASSDEAFARRISDCELQFENQGLVPMGVSA
jgi:ABC-type transporter Mla maintaining outer membrane lipid asymmetry ATPase subunit MlaF